MAHELCVSSDGDQAAAYLWASQFLSRWYSPGHHAEPFDVAANQPYQLVVARSSASFVDKTAGNATPLWLSQESAAPVGTVFLASLAHPKYRLKRPLPITIQSGDIAVSAYSYDIDEMGIGPNASEALDDIRSSIVDVYELLSLEQGNLGPLQVAHWEFLKDIVEVK